MRRQTRTTQLQIRLTPAEKRSITASARNAGLSVSAWVLARLVPDLRRTIERHLRDMERPLDAAYAVAELNDVLTRIGREEFERTFDAPLRLPQSPRLQNQVAAMIELAAHRVHADVPSWVREIPPLAEPHFGTSLVGLRLHLLTRSPPPFRRRNIFIDSSLGDRH